MMDARPVKHRKVRQPQQYQKYSQQKQQQYPQYSQYQKYQDYPSQSASPSSASPSAQHQRVRSSPAQVFVNPEHESTPLWQRFNTKSNNQVYEHTNKSDDSLELMPTLAMGYENSIDKKLQQKRGELRITSDGYFFDQGYESDNGYREPCGNGYRYDMDGPGDGRYGPRVSRAYDEQDYRYNKQPVHPVYDQDFWRSDYDDKILKNHDDSRQYDHFNNSVASEASETMSNRFKRIETRPSEPNLKKIMVEPVRVSSGGSVLDSEKITHMIPSGGPTLESERVSQSTCDLTSIPTSGLEIRISPTESNDQPFQQLQQLQPSPQTIKKSTKKRGLFKKIFLNNNTSKKHDKVSSKSDHKQTSNLRDLQQFQPNNIVHDLQEVDNEEPVIISNNNVLPITEDISADETLSNLATFVMNFPIISNLFHKIDDSSLPPQSKLLLKAGLIVWVLYEINTVFEIFGEWFHIIGSVFTTSNNID